MTRSADWRETSTPCASRSSGSFGELRATNEQLEDANRTLEQRVVERTAELVGAHADVAEGRSRLTDAIESISEGFALFDADDRLMVCNSRFRELYFGIADIVEPGVAFEDIVRAAAARNITAESRDGAEEWIQTRLGRHREPGSAFLQHRATIVGFRSASDIPAMAERSRSTPM
jgi:PAS domain-containing protein